MPIPEEVLAVARHQRRAAERGHLVELPVQFVREGRVSDFSFVKPLKPHGQTERGGI